jgi:hypothetical protein
MTRKTPEMPKFKNESEEADWWASRAGRAFVQRFADHQGAGTKLRGSSLIAKMNQKSTVQIALRLPQADLTLAIRPC